MFERDPKGQHEGGEVLANNNDKQVPGDWWIYEQHDYTKKKKEGFRKKGET